MNKIGNPPPYPQTSPSVMHDFQPPAAVAAQHFPIPTISGQAADGHHLADGGRVRIVAEYSQQPGIQIAVILPQAGGHAAGCHEVQVKGLEGVRLLLSHPVEVAAVLRAAALA